MFGRTEEINRTNLESLVITEPKLYNEGFDRYINKIFMLMFNFFTQVVPIKKFTFIKDLYLKQLLGMQCILNPDVQ